MSFGSLDSVIGVPKQERIKLCKQIRQKQVENYLDFLAREELNKVVARRQPNKKNTHPHFSMEVLLQTAVEEFNDRDAVQLLRNCADVNIKTGNNTSLLHKCCSEGHVTIAEQLIGQGADVNAVDDDWWTPLHVACYQDNTEMVLLLLQNGADFTMVDIDGNFAIDHTTPNSDTWDVMSSYQNEKGLDSATLTGIRLQRCKEVMSAVKQCLADKVNINTPLHDGVTWLHIASANGYRKLVKLLINNNVSVNAVDNNGWTPLHVAAKFSQGKVVVMLLKANADADVVDRHGRRAVEIAGTDDIKKVILDWRRKKTKTEAVPEVLYDTIDDDGIESDGEAVVSKAVHPSNLSLSKTELLIETEMRYKLETGSDEPRWEEGDSDDDADDDVYLSTIWKASDESNASLPSVSSDDDLTSFSDITQKLIVDTLLDRYNRNLIYTNIGDILIALNPYQAMPIYSKSISKQYREMTKPSSLTPHIYAIAEQAHRQLVAMQTSQCCLISGESGAGKTESCKLIVQHLVRTSGSTESSLSSKINQVNPLLEAFGNAQTVMNNNSSRFAKFLELFYSPDGSVLGAKMCEYLLEKSRVVKQGKGEFNFHIFYWMLAGITPEEMNKCQFEVSHQYRYLQTDQEPLTDKLGPGDKEKFWEVKECLSFIGFSKDDIICLVMTLAAILHLGNTSFVATGDSEAADVENIGTLRKASSLLRVPFKDLKSALIEEVMIARGEEMKRSLTVIQAEDSRDALAKTLYSRLFSWIVNGINQMVQPVEDGMPSLSLGILDIFGFENLEKNSFEQMCINVANERLQMFFNERVFQQEQQECFLEGVSVPSVSYSSNQPVINLFLEKNTGVLALLDEECMFPKSTDKSLAVKLHQVTGEHYSDLYKTPRDRGTTFTVMHYAGAIQYHVDGILDKNRDTLRQALSFTVRSSSSLLIKELFQAQLTKTGSINPSGRQRMSRQLKQSKTPFEFFKKLKTSKKDEKKQKKAGARPISAVSRKGPSTMAYHFRNSLREMMEKVNTANAHFVRCIKPNTSCAPKIVMSEYVQAQLKYSGVMETVTIRKFGFAMRVTFTDFLKRFDCLHLAINSSSCSLTDQQACQNILNHAHLTDYQMGKTKVFLHQSHVDKLRALARQHLAKIIKAQSVLRGFICRRKLKLKKAQSEKEVSEVITFLQQVEEKQTTLSNLMSDQRKNDDFKTQQEKDLHKSLEVLDSVINEFEQEYSALSRAQKTPDRDFYSIGEVGTENTALPTREDDEEYIDVTSCRTVESRITQDRPRSEDMDPSRAIPPAPKEMYQGLYETIPADEPLNEVFTIRKPAPCVPIRSPETRLSTFSIGKVPTSPLSDSGIYNEPDVFDHSYSSQNKSPWQPRPSSPLAKRNQNHQPQSPQLQDNRPFSYGVNLPQSPKHHIQSPRQPGYPSPVNGSETNGYRTRSSSGASSGSSESNYAYTRWIQNESGPHELPPLSAGEYRNVHCVAGPSAHHMQGPPLCPQPPNQPPPHHFDKQVQQLRNNAMSSSPVNQRQNPAAQYRQDVVSGEYAQRIPQTRSPVTHRRQDILTEHAQRIQQTRNPNLQLNATEARVAPYSSEHDSVSLVPPPPSFPAPPPPVSPSDRYLAAWQEKRSPSPPPPPPPLQSKGQDKTYMSPPSSNQNLFTSVEKVPPPPPPISTIPSQRPPREREVPTTSMMSSRMAENQNVSSLDQTQSALLAELSNIRLKKTQNMAVSMPTNDIPEDMPPPPPPPPQPEADPVKPVAVVTALTQESTKPNFIIQKKKKEKTSLPFNMDMDIPADIDISNVPGVVPITSSTPNWKREMIAKKNREKIEEYVKKVLKDREEAAKWRDVPEWKRKILKQKQQEDNAQSAPADSKPADVPKPDHAAMGVPKQSGNIVPAALNMDPAELESMPPWKRELLMKRPNVPKTFFNEFEPEEGEVLQDAS
ncbi:unconventional myosin-XVI-like [Gigantopelta aegis]|uniref:unconventional myosin-XVI-like n=1 Tax=Gigantopelta aegis TaxID=1735272 RepID=UPI001B88D9AD|nr:unconventional myosin-XVI-like [Gigantopelta aegis]XP_041356946.1 unconventional myosin-XVI-like [Gigantopelta aegis]